MNRDREDADFAGAAGAALLEDEAAIVELEEVVALEADLDDDDFPALWCLSGSTRSASVSGVALCRGRVTVAAGGDARGTVEMRPRKASSALLKRAGGLALRLIPASRTCSAALCLADIISICDLVYRT